MFISLERYLPSMIRLPHSFMCGIESYLTHSSVFLSDYYIQRSHPFKNLDEKYSQTNEIIQLTALLSKLMNKRTNRGRLAELTF